VVLVTSEKDKSRYHKLPVYPMGLSLNEAKEILQPNVYYKAIPMQENGVNATTIRNRLKTKEDFVRFYGIFDEDVYDLLMRKLDGY
jgi:hypothetical protein